jgi:hypothetical protein
MLAITFNVNRKAVGTFFSSTPLRLTSDDRVQNDARLGLFEKHALNPQQ